MSALMYSGTTYHNRSDRVMGVHQRIDRIARRSLKKYDATSARPFPAITDILHFEGKNGPDGIKRKSPGRDEPWHFIESPGEVGDDLREMISDHIHNLSVALRDTNTERAAFEAAWLAHAVTDGLTPAHHFPLEDKLMELRGGQGLHTRNSKRDKIVLPGSNRRHQLKNNWEFWGAKGVMTTHFGFELGVMTTLASQRIVPVELHPREIELLRQKGFSQLYDGAVKKIHALDMYTEFSKKGWTRRLAHETKETLTPLISRVVTLAWIEAIWKSKEADI